VNTKNQINQRHSRNGLLNQCKHNRLTQKHLKFTKNILPKKKENGWINLTWKQRCSRRTWRTQDIKIITLMEGRS